MPLFSLLSSSSSSSSQVVAVHCKYVKPRTVDVSGCVLSEVTRNDFGITEDQVKSGQPLEQVIEEVSDLILCLQKELD